MITDIREGDIVSTRAQRVLAKRGRSHIGRAPNYIAIADSLLHNPFLFISYQTS